MASCCIICRQNLELKVLGITVRVGKMCQSVWTCSSGRPSQPAVSACHAQSVSCHKCAIGWASCIVMYKMYAQPERIRAEALSFYSASPSWPSPRILSAPKTSRCCTCYTKYPSRHLSTLHLHSPAVPSLTRCHLWRSARWRALWHSSPALPTALIVSRQYASKSGRTTRNSKPT